MSFLFFSATSPLFPSDFFFPRASVIFGAVEEVFGPSGFFPFTRSKASSLSEDSLLDSELLLGTVFLTFLIPATFFFFISSPLDSSLELPELSELLSLALEFGESYTEVLAEGPF